MRLPFASQRTAIAVLSLSLLVQDVMGRRALMSGASRRTRMMEALLNQPTEYEDTPPPDPSEGCPEKYGTPVTAPKVSLWRSLSGPETAEVVQWLFAQEELNLTVSSKAGEWDNQM